MHEPRVVVGALGHPQPHAALQPAANHLRVQPGERVVKTRASLDALEVESESQVLAHTARDVQ
jgi:hypothetical protein